MPIADKPTAHRDPNDLWPERFELTAFLYAEQFVPTPQLVFAAELQARILSEPDTPDWFNLKAMEIRQCD
jgi:hypothetical protein